MPRCQGQAGSRRRTGSSGRRCRTPAWPSPTSSACGLRKRRRRWWRKNDSGVWDPLPQRGSRCAAVDVVDEDVGGAGGVRGCCVAPAEGAAGAGAWRSPPRRKGSPPTTVAAGASPQSTPTTSPLAGPPTYPTRCCCCCPEAAWLRSRRAGRPWPRSPVGRRRRAVRVQSPPPARATRRRRSRECSAARTGHKEAAGR